MSRYIQNIAETLKFLLNAYEQSVDYGISGIISEKHALERIVE